MLIKVVNENILENVIKLILEIIKNYLILFETHR